MVFKKPYAFLIKYFKIINLILSILVFYLVYKLNNLHKLINQVYIGSVSNYSSLKSNYLGWRLYFTIFIIAIILIFIIMLLKKKKKPLKDYSMLLIYIVVVLIFLSFINNLFLSLEETIVEQTTLKTYSDISLIIIIPLIYFIIKYILNFIGFNLKKFNFQKDLLELKQEEKDNEEVEIILDKNTYKYKRGIRKYIRELKYYFLENKYIIGLISIILIVILFSTLFTINLFDKSNYKLNQQFQVNNYTIKVNKVYETEYDLNNSIVRDDSKFVIVNLNIKNNGETSLFDYNNIRLVYKNDYVYATSYFNKYFLDIGTPYNSELLKQGQVYNYNFIFKVPKDYKRNNYSIKFYDRISYEENEAKGVYKIVKAKANIIDSTQNIKEYSLKDNIVFDSEIYGNTNLTIQSYDFKSSYTYQKQYCQDENNCSTKTEIIRDAQSSNKTLLILDYELSLDKENLISNYFVNDILFFNEFLKVEYTYNGKTKTLNSVNTIDKVDNKIFISIPYEIQNSEKINLIFNLRNTKIIYRLK